MKLRDLPSVDELLRDERLAHEPREQTLAAVRQALDRARDRIRTGDEPGDLVAQVLDELDAARRPSLRRVLNATGVIVHTNLGRAPLPEAAIHRVAEVGRSYSNLEYDTAAGARGSRQDHLSEILQRLTGAEAALVVNNNAAAVLLALAALAEGREVLVSRGELIEIGDGFRIPDVLARSGARLVEVGTTNRTRASDYQHAIGPETAVLLRVHQSNFRVVGFTELPDLAELAQVAKGAGLPLVDDLGSGALVPLGDEPTARGSLAAGADLVCFSGDKLLGGPQAGIVVGDSKLVERLRRHPLQRALRADKLTLAALEGTLALYLDPERARREIPVLRMLDEPAAAVRARAERLAVARRRRGRGDGGACRRWGPAARRALVVCVCARRGSGRTAAQRRPAGDRGRPRWKAPARLPHADRRRDRRRRSRSTRAASGMSLTVGTAGHIDHGKTWLVRALTGKDTDRLPEERRRGISIDLGYAPLELADGRRLSLVDVPGHERFVRTMVAGATGIDLFLLAVDAGEGARPQTHEHLAVLRLLGVETGVVAVTKSDAVDEETLELAVLEAHDLVPGAEVVAVSARTGSGLDELRAAIGRVAETVPGRSSERPTRLYVDRIFTLHGIGTVVTGTLWSGSIGEGDELRIEPARPARAHPQRAGARRVPSSGRTRDSGSRVSLPGVDREEVRRGDALVAAGCVPASRTGSTWRSTSSRPFPTTPASPCTMGRGGWRRGSPASAGGTHSCAWTSPWSRRVATASCCEARRRSAGGSFSTRRPLGIATRSAWSGWSVGTSRPRSMRRCISRRCDTSMDGEPAGIERAGPWAFSSTWPGGARGRSAQEDRARRPARPPELPVPSEPWAADVTARCRSSAAAPVVPPGSSGTLGERQAEADALEAELSAAGVAATKVEDADLSRFLEREGRLVRLGDGYVIGSGGYEVAKDVLVGSARRPARSRSPASATSRVRAAATRSSCSSASTGMGSPGGSAMRACCAVPRAPPDAAL